MAQEPTLGGQVNDALTSEPVEGALVAVLGRSGGERCRTETDAAGYYRVSCVGPGEWMLRVTRYGYRGERRWVVIAEGARSRADFALAPGPERLEPLVVTASRRPEALHAASAAIDVVTSEEIDREAVADVAESFRSVSGLNFAQGSSGNFNFSARGFNSSASRRMVLLIDGRRASSSNLLNFVAWDALTLTEDEVERVEILKGPGAALYGANAHSGIVQLVSRSPSQLQGTAARVAGGELGTLKASLVHGGAIGELSYKVSSGYLLTDEWPLASGTRFLAGAQTVPYEESVAPGSERRRWKADVAAELPVGADGRVSVSSGLSIRDGTWITGAGRVQQDGDRYTYVAGRYDNPRFTLQGSWNFNDSGEWVLLRNGQLFYELSNDLALEARGRAPVSDRALVQWGVSYRRIAADTRDVTFPGTRTQDLYGVFAQGEANLLPELRLIAAGRADHHPQTGWQLSPKAGLVAAVAPDHAVQVSYSQGYQNPSLVELFIELDIPQPDGPTIVVRGKGGLEPERIDAYEVGYRGSLAGRARLTIDLFHQEVRDFISDLVPVQAEPPTLSYRQGGRSTVNGVDLGLSLFLAPWLSFTNSYSYVDVDGADQTPNVPRHRWSGSLEHQDRRGWFAALAVHFVDEFEWQAGQLLATIPSYTIFDATLGFAPRGGRWSLTTKSRNLLDDEHLELAGGSAIGRQWVIELGVKF